MVPKMMGEWRMSLPSMGRIEKTRTPESMPKRINDWTPSSMRLLPQDLLDHRLPLQVSRLRSRKNLLVRRRTRSSAIDCVLCPQFAMR